MIPPIGIVAAIACVGGIIWEYTLHYCATKITAA